MAEILSLAVSLLILAIVSSLKMAGTLLSLAPLIEEDSGDHSGKAELPPGSLGPGNRTCLLYMCETWVQA